VAALMQNMLRFARKGLHILVDRLRNQGLRVTLIWLYGRGVPKLTGIPLVRYSRVTPEVWVGGQFGRRGKRKLEQHGVTGNVNLRSEFDDAAHGLALEQYCHLPTVDDTAPTLEHLQQGADFIARVVGAGGTVYIHCAGGVGRAPTLAAAYFIAQGHTLDEAIALIKRIRPFIRIMPPQWAQLQQFETLYQSE
jgi:protein-tyrosine phosphatase